jgi:hypothetical protein
MVNVFSGSIDPGLVVHAPSALPFDLILVCAVLYLKAILVLPVPVFKLFAHYDSYR